MDSFLFHLSGDYQIDGSWLEGDFRDPETIEKERRKTSVKSIILSDRDEACFKCPLDYCVGEESKKCPIHINRNITAKKENET